jgi:hypothetical protein
MRRQSARDAPKARVRPKAPRRARAVKSAEVFVRERRKCVCVREREREIERSERAEVFVGKDGSQRKRERRGVYEGQEERRRGERRMEVGRKK